MTPATCLSIAIRRNGVSSPCSVSIQSLSSEQCLSTAFVLCRIGRMTLLECISPPMVSQNPAVNSCSTRATPWTFRYGVSYLVNSLFSVPFLILSLLGCQDVTGDESLSGDCRGLGHAKNCMCATPGPPAPTLAVSPNHLERAPSKNSAENNAVFLGLPPPKNSVAREA